MPTAILTNGNVLIVLYDMLADFERNATSDPERGQEVLEMMYATVRDKLLASKPEPHETAAALFLSEYFKHRGDWTAMRCCIERSITSAAVDVDALRANLRAQPLPSFFNKQAAQ